MSVDLSNIKPGDEVTVRCVVLENDGSEAFPVRAKNSNGDPFWPSPDTIMAHHPKALSVGDRVKAEGWKVAVFTVVAIDDGWAWIKDDESSRLQLPLSDLERIP